MKNLLPALAIAFASFGVWLTVRIVNRRERWAKWTAVAVGLPLLYVASFGPACGLVARDVVPPTILESFFRPCLDLALDGPSAVQYPLWYWTGICDGKLALIGAQMSREDAVDTRLIEKRTRFIQEYARFVEETEREYPSTFRVVGIMSDGERDIVAEGLDEEMAAAIVEYVLRKQLRDEARIEPE